MTINMQHVIKMLVVVSISIPEGIFGFLQKEVAYQLVNNFVFNVYPATLKMLMMYLIAAAFCIEMLINQTNNILFYWNYSYIVSVKLFIYVEN